MTPAHDTHANETGQQHTPAWPSDNRKPSGTARTMPTSSRLSALMLRAKSAADDDVRGAVDLIPTLSYGYGEWSASFKVAAPAGTYVLKSISDFLEHSRAGERCAYGKKLAFAHVPEAFTARGRALVRFLDRAERARRRAEASWQQRERGVLGRELPLSPSELIDLLDIMQGARLDVRGTDPGTRALTHVRVTDHEPRIGLAIVPEDGGYRIEARQDVILVRSGARLYLWDDEAIHRCPDSWGPCADLLAIALDPEEPALFIARSDLPLFCATLLPAAEAALPLDVPPELQAYKLVTCALRFYFDREGNDVVCEAKAAYGAREFRVGTNADDSEGGVPSGDLAFGNRVPDAPTPDNPASGPEAFPARDAKQEAQAEELVERYFGAGRLPAPARLPLGAEQDVARLLFGGLAEFRALGEVHATAAFERLIRDKAPRVTLGVAMAGNLLNLTVSADDLSPADLAALLASYRARKRYHRLRDGLFVDLQECNLAQLDRITADLGVTRTQLATGTVELPSFRAFYLDEEHDLERDRSFDRYLENFRAVSEESYAVPATLAGTLRPYQAEGFRWLSARCDAGFGGILADEMGLGKSLQVIALLAARQSEAAAVGPSLIVCPASLVYNWLAEIARFAPELRACTIAGTKRERARTLAGAFAREGANGTAPFDVLVTSYDTLRVDCDALAERSFWCCVLDEAQYVKNPATRTARAAKRVNASHRFALTGTPFENRLSDLWSIFDFLMPGLLGPYARFRETFELPIAGGDEDAAARLRRLAGPFMLRRHKADVLADLPEKLESTVRVVLEGEQRRLYDAREQQLRERLSEQRRIKGGKGRARAVTPEARAAAATAAAAGDDFTKRQVEVLAEITKLRQVCCDPALLYEGYTGPAAKLQAVADIVESARDGGEKVLVFSQFTGFLDLIATQLDLRRIPHFSITGATPKEQRLELVNRFNADDTPAFLISLKAGGTGLNLTGASVVVHADPWWNAAAQDQATDRAHRIGQTRAVSVLKVIAQDTIEERIERLQQEKAALADHVIGASGTSLAGLTRDDLLELLG